MSKLKGHVIRSAQYFLLSKKKGDEQIVIKLILIGVAVILGFLFKTEVTSIVTNAMDSFTTKIDSLIA